MIMFLIQQPMAIKKGCLLRDSLVVITEIKV
jgi:hypothetical protein